AWILADRGDSKVAIDHGTAHNASAIFGISDKANGVDEDTEAGAAVAHPFELKLAVWTGRQEPAESILEIVSRNSRANEIVAGLDCYGRSGGGLGPIRYSVWRAK